MKVKLIKENYFGSVKDRVEKRKGEDAVERVTKLSKAILNKKVVDAFTDIVKGSDSTVSALNTDLLEFYGFTEDFLFPKWANMSQQLWDLEWTKDMQFNFTADVSKKTITVDLTYGKNYTPKHKSLGSDTVWLYANVTVREIGKRLVARNVERKSETNPALTLRYLEDEYNAWFEYYLNMIVETEDTKTLKEYKVVLNPIHMFPGGNFDVKISYVFDPQNNDPSVVKTEQLIEWYNDEIIETIGNIFSFENNGKALIKLKKDPRYLPVNSSKQNNDIE